jgi:hypothetical protein
VPTEEHKGKLFGFEFKWKSGKIRKAVKKQYLPGWFKADPKGFQNRFFEEELLQIFINSGENDFVKPFGSLNCVITVFFTDAPEASGKNQ